MKTIKILFTLLFLFLILGSCSNSVSGTPEKKEEEKKSGWNLTWSDEFDYTDKPDSTKWGYEIGGNGWGNNEEEYYTSDSNNVRVENGNLVIEAHYYENHPIKYTSARLVSTNKGDWTYGRFEVRAKLPKGKGTWPAIWMLPTEWTYGSGGWPDNGEIDIMEHVGYDPGVIHGSTHSKKYYWRINTQKTATIKIPDAMNEFHTYTMEWYPDRIDMYVDDQKYFTSENDSTGWEAWPFNKDFHFILNLAIGGDWGGAQGIDNSIFPQRMEVDYVRVYEWKD